MPPVVNHVRDHLAAGHDLATRRLDAGAVGLVFPHVDTAEPAARLG